MSRSLALATVVAIDRSRSRLPTAKPKKRAELIDVLRSDAPAAEKALACKQLAVYGSSEAVPELAKLLTNEQLASWARIALEAIPGHRADEALRKGADSLKGRLLVGTINSIGVRRDAGAVDPLTGRLEDKDAEVASAAAVALGHIGNAAATKSLRQIAGRRCRAVRSAVAEGCVLCAERLLSDGNGAKRRRSTTKCAKPRFPGSESWRRHAERFWPAKADGIPLLVEQLRSNDKGLFQIGLSTARELSGSEVAKPWRPSWLGVPGTSGALACALADRRRHGRAARRVEGGRRLGRSRFELRRSASSARLGDASCSASAAGDRGRIGRRRGASGKTALAGLPGETVDAEIVTRLVEGRRQNRSRC